MKYLSLAAILLTSSLFMNCSKDDEKPINNSPLITLTTGHYVNEGTSRYLVVTDTSNNVVTYIKIENDKVVEVKPTNGYNGDIINAYLVDDYAPFYKMSVYLKIKRGSIWDFKGTQTSGNGLELKSPIKLKLKNAGDFQYLTIGSNFFGYTMQNSSFNDTTTFGTRFSYFEGGKIYAQKVINNQGKYSFIDIDNTKTAYDVDFTSFTGVSITKKITTPFAEYGGSFTLRGLPGDTSYPVYSLFNCYVGGTDFTIYYPDLAFPRYNTTLSFFNGNKYYYYDKTGVIPTTYGPITLAAEIKNNNPNAFKVSLTGDLDYYSAAFRNGTGQKEILVYASHKVNNFSIPDLSSAIPIPLNIFSDVVLKGLRLVSMEDVVEDKGYLEYYSTFPTKISTDSKAVTLLY